MTQCSGRSRVTICAWWCVLSLSAVCLVWLGLPLIPCRNDKQLNVVDDLLGGFHCNLCGSNNPSSLRLYFRSPSCCIPNATRAVPSRTGLRNLKPHRPDNRRPRDTPQLNAKVKQTVRDCVQFGRGPAVQLKLGTIVESLREAQRAMGE
jgi:hypothetical protein